MVALRPVLMMLVLGCVALAGCTEGEPENLAQDVDPCLVENPGDFDACAEEPVGVDGTVSHVHDYWGGRDELTVIEEVQDTGGTWFGGPMAWAQFRPEPERVVPQGTASVNITISWDDPGTQEWYGNPQLWVRKASDDESKFIADVSSGDTVEMTLVKEDADLPHQVLSSWVFEWVVSVPDDVRPVTYSGEVTLLVTAHRGLPIEAYPGHPDRWDNQTEWLVLEAADQQIYGGDGTNQDWSCISGCPEVYTPNDGIIIPFDADRVEAVLTLEDDTPFVMGLAYHGASSREFLYPEPTKEDGLTRHYSIPVGPDGDGPYAIQSLWEFAVVIEEPERDGWTSQAWSLEVTVHRHPAE